MPYFNGIFSRKKVFTLREIRDQLHTAYCGRIGVEYMHIPNRDQCNWIRDKIENKQFDPVPKQTKLKILERIMYAD
jgi:2-oxoglutarate dehydrogenase E1 component